MGTEKLTADELRQELLNLSAGMRQLAGRAREIDRDLGANIEKEAARQEEAAQRVQLLRPRLRLAYFTDSHVEPCAECSRDMRFSQFCLLTEHDGALCRECAERRVSPLVALCTFLEQTGLEDNTAHLSNSLLKRLVRTLADEVGSDNDEIPF